jgi:DNA invertase Pin-like site-specific DNA recombinase
MIYCYLRVSTDSQDVDSQRLGIQDFCRARGWTDMEWISDEGVSGAKDPSKRLLGKLLKKARSGDCVIASEISRIGRKLDMILNVIKDCTERGIKLYTVKDRYVLEDTIQSKVLVTVMGLAAEIERDLLRQRTKEGLRRAVERGVTLGRPVGRKSSETKLSRKSADVDRLIGKGLTKCAAAKKLNVHRITFAKYLAERGLKWA